MIIVLFGSMVDFCDNLPKYIAMSVKFSWPGKDGTCFSFDFWLAGFLPLSMSNIAFYLYMSFLPMPVSKQLKYLLRYYRGRCQEDPFFLYISSADPGQSTRLT